MGDCRRQELVERLHRRTMDGAVIWEKTINEGVYQTAFPTYALQIACSERQVEPAGRRPSYQLTIYDSTASVVDTINDREFGGWPGASSKMAEIHATARRTAMDVDRALDELLEALAS